MFLPTERIVEVGQATVAIDRVVEKDGLVRIAWRLDGETVVDSYIRPQDASARAVSDEIGAPLDPDRNGRMTVSPAAALCASPPTRPSSCSRTAPATSGAPTAPAGTTLGEVVFATGMTGYQETLTDPSYAGQIVLQTAPHIGNTGMNAEDPESRRIWVSGYIVRDPSRVVSNWRADESLDDALVSDGVVGISGIDTRAVTRHIRSAGSMRGGIFSGDAAGLSARRAARASCRARPEMSGRNLSAEVSVVARSR